MPETADEQRDDEQREERDEQREQQGDPEALRREAAKWRRELRAAQKTNDELRAELERHRVESESDIDRAKREAVEEAKAQWEADHAAEQLHSRLRARAVGKLRDADDAVLHLGAALDPNADNAAIDEAIDELIKQRDYLAAPANGGTERAGLVTQGARSPAPGSGGAQSPDDWIRARARGGR
jgi:membrane protein involved in colicin uptake